jgi:NAD(P)-dependent dehydrogenase (short-subunit alcohol dehydrogenase family)
LQSTGGNRSIRRPIALAMAGAGASVAIVARTEKFLCEVAKEIEAAGASCLAVPCDVSDPVSVQAPGDAVLFRYGRAT